MPKKSLANRIALAPARLINKGLAKVDAHAKKVSAKNAAKRAAEKVANKTIRDKKRANKKVLKANKKAADRKRGVEASLFGIPLVTNQNFKGLKKENKKGFNIK